MREIDPVADAIASSTAAPVALLFYFGLSQSVYRTTATLPITYEGATYLPLGDVGAVESVEDAAGKANSLRFSLNGVKTELLALALGENIKNKTVEMRLAILSPVDYSLKDAVMLWRGSFDQMPIQVSGREMVIQAVAEHRGVTFSRARSFRYVNSDQVREFPGDTSLRFIAVQAYHRDVWPSRAFFQV